MTYYSAIIQISILLVAVILVSLHDNETISRERKKTLIFIGILIIVATLCESVAFVFNGKSHFQLVHAIIKSIEFSIAPIIPIFFSWVLTPKGFSTKKRCVIITGLVLNSLFEFMSVIIPFTFYIDSNNMYYKGSYYWIYIATYTIGIIYLVIELFCFAKRFQSRSLLTLVFMLLFLIQGFVIRRCNYQLYTDWLIVSISYAVFIIVYSDISLKADPLTFLLNRQAYIFRFRKINYTTAFFILDANNFKLINDTLGHISGDEALQVIAKFIRKAYGSHADCYRLGGDEFCVILKRNHLRKIEEKSENHNTEQALVNLNKKLNDLIQNEIEEEIKNQENVPLINGVSIGFSVFYTLEDELKYKNLDFASDSLTQAVKIADVRMYQSKELHIVKPIPRKTE